ncbi:unnamed protein product [Closterium sp. Yama58-4]|nr:unnamed protein product [Closterium sp. Yama58-4]
MALQASSAKSRKASRVKIASPVGAILATRRLESANAKTIKDMKTCKRRFQSLSSLRKRHRRDLKAAGSKTDTSATCWSRARWSWSHSSAGTLPSHAARRRRWRAGLYPSRWDGDGPPAAPRLTKRPTTTMTYGDEWRSHGDGDWLAALLPSASHSDGDVSRHFVPEARVGAHGNITSNGGNAGVSRACGSGGGSSRGQRRDKEVTQWSPMHEEAGMGARGTARRRFFGGAERGAVWRIGARRSSALLSAVVV